MSKPTVSIISLGCAKNQVDAEAMLKQLHTSGYEIKDDPAHASCVIINTCGFLCSAREEAVESIIEMGKLKPEGTIKAIIVSGCMAQSIGEQILSEMPEVDGVIGLSGANDICTYVDKALTGERFCIVEEPEKLNLDMPRILGNEPYFAYLKIADGCDNRCAYCMIPAIRGAFRSRTMESVIAEAADLAKKGVKELNVIAQDTTRYGEDIYGEKKLPELLSELCKIEGIRWIRVLYAYPDRVTDELLETMNREEKIVKYLDLQRHRAETNEPQRRREKLTGAYCKNSRKGTGYYSSHHAHNRFPRGNQGGLCGAVSVRKGHEVRPSGRLPLFERRGHPRL